MSPEWEKETTKGRIERLIEEGKITAEAVAQAEEIWEDQLQEGVLLPNGETASITLDDLYHLIVDNRIWRKPERIERILNGIFEIRTAREGRRMALSRWSEDGETLIGYAILTPEGRVWTVHLLDDRGLRRLKGQGDLLWTL